MAEKSKAGKLYLDQKNAVDCMSHSGNRSGGTTNVQTQNGIVLQEGPTESTYSCSFQMVRNSEQFRTLFNKRRNKEEVRLTRGVLGTGVESVMCVIDSLNDTQDHGNGTSTFEATLRATAEPEII